MDGEERPAKKESYNRGDVAGGGRKRGGKHIALFSRWHPQRGRGQWLEEDKSPDKSKLPGDC